MLLAVFLGALLAYVVYPLYRFIKKKIKNETVSSLLVSIVVLLILVIPAAFLAKVMVQQSYVLYVLIKQKLAVGLFESCQNSFCQALKEMAQNETLKSYIVDMFRIGTNWIVQKGSDILISLPRLLLNIFVIFFTMFYFLKDGHKLIALIGDYFSEHKKKYFFIIHRLKEILDGVIYGYLLVAIIQGALGALGFFLFGISSPLFWGMIMGLLALIPLLGTGIIWVPASAMLILEGIFNDSTGLIIKGVGLLVYSFIFIGSIDNIIRPKLIGRKAKVHTALIMVGIFGGILAFGPVGVIAGPIILTLTTEVVHLYLTEK